MCDCDRYSREALIKRTESPNKERIDKELKTVFFWIDYAVERGVYYCEINELSSETIKILKANPYNYTITTIKYKNLVGGYYEKFRISWEDK